MRSFWSKLYCPKMSPSAGWPTQPTNQSSNPDDASLRGSTLSISTDCRSRKPSCTGTAFSSSKTEYQRDAGSLSITHLRRRRSTYFPCSLTLLCRECGWTVKPQRAAPCPAMTWYSAVSNWLQASMPWKSALRACQSQTQSLWARSQLCLSARSFTPIARDAARDRRISAHTSIRGFDDGVQSRPHVWGYLYLGRRARL